MIRYPLRIESHWVEVHAARLIVGVLLLLGVLTSSGTTTADTPRLLIDGQVLDATSGKPVEVFRVIPGVRYNRSPGVRGNIAVWQPHMIREMKDGAFQWPRTRGYDEMRFRIEADGYRPATTTWLGKGGPHLRMKVHLRADPGIEGVVLAPDGTPASGAVLAIALPNRTVRLDGCQVDGQDSPLPERLSDQWRRPQLVRANEQGEFLLPFETDNAAQLCIVHQSGYFERDFNDFTDDLSDQPGPITIELERWGRVDGRVIWKDKPEPEATISATIHRNEPYPGLIEARDMAITDAQGNYSFAYLPSGNVQLGHSVKQPAVDSKSPVETNSKELGPKNTGSANYEYPVQNVSVTVGRALKVDFGGEGSEVIGRLTGLPGYENVTISIRPPAPDVWRWNRFGNRGANEMQRGFEALQAAPYASLYFRSKLSVADDGTFRIKDVMTGRYNLWVEGASGTKQFTLKSGDDSPLDLGTIQVRPK